MKRKKRSLVIAFIILFLIIFGLCVKFWYNATDNMYQKDNFRETIIEEMHEKPDDYYKYFGVKNEEDLTKEKVDEIYQKARLGRMMFLIMASMPTALVGTGLLFIPVLALRSVKRKYYKYRLSIDEFSKNKDYYRDLLQEYNPLELSYNNNYQLDDNAYIAMLLYLENKKIITYDKDKINVNQKNVQESSDVVKEFLSSLTIDKTNKITISKTNITKLVDMSCKEKGLLTMGKIPKTKFWIDVTLSVIGYGIIYYVWKNINAILNLLPATDNVFFVMLIMSLLIGLMLIIIFYPFIIISKYGLLSIIFKVDHSKRTKMGNEVNYNLEGLKNFIRDFSLLSEKEKKELVIWDEYLVYSVMFGNNKKISDEMQDKIDYIF